MSSATGPPLLWLALDPKTDADAQRLDRALVRLAAEDTAMIVRTGHEEGRRVIGCANDEHLATVVDRLWREFGVNARCGRPELADRPGE